MSDSDPELASEEGQDGKEAIGDSGTVIRFEDLLDDHDVFVEVPGIYSNLSSSFRSSESF